MEVIRVGSDFGARDGEGADSELEELEAVGGSSGLEVGGFRAVKGGDAVPSGRERAGVLEGNGDEVGRGEVGVEVVEGVVEVGFCNLLYAPLELMLMTIPGYFGAKETPWYQSHHFFCFDSAGFWSGLSFGVVKRISVGSGTRNLARTL